MPTELWGEGTRAVHAVEYWEEYNDACFECTDLSMITQYTNTNDWAYPVYVWVRGKCTFIYSTILCKYDFSRQTDNTRPIGHEEQWLFEVYDFRSFYCKCHVMIKDHL